MKAATRFELRPIAELFPYANNAKTHPPEQIEALRRSLREFGFVAPVVIDEAGNVIAGHGRLLAAQANGETMAPCVIADYLTEDQRRAYILADNKLSEMGGWDEGLVHTELFALQDAGFDVTLTGFEPAGIYLDAEEPEAPFWGDVETESTEEYEQFVDKFKPKLTTDDVYTPDNVYEAVRSWAVEHYQLEGAPIVRPFYPGGDYKSADYPAGCVVIDNPPFSILSEICAWYEEHGVRYLLFAPGLTLFSINSGRSRYLPVGIAIEYTNGASISTSFVTNMGPWRIELCPELYQAIDAANSAKAAKSLPVYQYPDNIASVAINKLAKRGIRLQIPEQEATFLRALDAQRDAGKAIYGGGFLLSTRMAEQKTQGELQATEIAAEEQMAAAGRMVDQRAAERSAAIKWPLSERELEIIAEMDKEAR